VKRVGEILRSVLPADLAQLLFIFGVVLLFISSYLRWGLMVEAPTVFAPEVLVLLAPYLIRFSGAAGYLLWFRPGSRLVRRLSWWVCFPALAAIVVESYFYRSIATSGTTALQSGKPYLPDVLSPLAVWTGLGPGFHYGVAGLVLVIAFTLRVNLGISSLPLSLYEPGSSTRPDALSWRRLGILLWVLLVWGGVGWLTERLMFVLLRCQAIAGWPPPLLRALVYGIGLAIFVGLAVCVVGKEAWTLVRRSIRLPLPESFLVAVMFPCSIVFLGSLGHYLLDSARWVVENSPASIPPQFGSYFGIPSVGLILSLLLPAFLEEVIFRGFLQPRFVTRYGVLRGMFLGSILWAAWHFAGDFSSATSDHGVLIRVSLRLSLCVAMGMVLGWLTLRTRSILPATLAHAVYNSFARLSLAGWGPGQSLVISIGWGLLAYLLFRQWPVQAGNAILRVHDGAEFIEA
jgi:membrane protease YdiL (CAAX protease family)